MLTLDECIPYVIISAQTLGKPGVGTVSELSIDNSIHEDEQRGGSVVSDSISQVDFDEYARCFANRHGIAIPSSCDALSRSSVNHHRFSLSNIKGEILLVAIKKQMFCQLSQKKL
ncbi:hypothetical protein BSD967_07715 [Bifidobacterium saguini]|uniref:Uncharacterized protein n=1 Tax=Bifidobacterium saguini TaxID=762210 RepID=A0ABX7SA16_9BIFI|nr:hypothetical protein [Bifidobacterium saguini]QTB90231.1 hypothetical protein BSD967_07715 [Bifidobacterium saguini]